MLAGYENAKWKFPTDVISFRRLTIIEFEGCFSVDSQVFSEILSTSHQLESMTLSGILECTLLVTFHLYRSSLPFLMHFVLNISDCNSPSACHGLGPRACYLRDHKHLRSFYLIIFLLRWQGDLFYGHSVRSPWKLWY